MAHPATGSYNGALELYLEARGRCRGLVSESAASRFGCCTAPGARYGEHAPRPKSDDADAEDSLLG